MDQPAWDRLSPEEKKTALFLKQKDLLDTFLSHHAISRAQYDKSLKDLREKMGIPAVCENEAEGKQDAVQDGIGLESLL